MSTQRRTYGFGTPDPSQQLFPHRSTSPSPLSPYSEDKKHHRRRTASLSRRIWVLVSVVAFIFLCIRIFSPSSKEKSRQVFTDPDLVPNNYLNSSDDPSHVPFDFCPLYGPGDPLVKKYGAYALAKSKVLLGSGARVQRVVRKALAGLPVTISVLGGSVSACHGAGNDPVSPDCYPSQFFRWWNELFPHPASELTNGAVRRSTSAYFSFCHGHHIPDHTDLVILEFDSDDPHEPPWLDHFELLVRSILIRPESPAVVILGHFTPQVQLAHGYVGPDFLHSIVAQFYDVPYISTKPILYSTHLRTPDTINSYFIDPILPSAAGHGLLVDVLISYFQSLICAAWASATGVGFEVPDFPTKDAPADAPADANGVFGGPLKQGGDGKRPRTDVEDDRSSVDSAAFHVPPARMEARPNDLKHFREVQPFCVSANDLVNPLPPSLFYGSGWHVFHPTKSEDGLAIHYWYSTLPTSKLRVPIKVGGGDVAIYYWHEEDEDEEFRSGVKCWVDDNWSGAVQIWNQGAGQPGPAVRVIDHSVAQGSHFVQCELLGEEDRGVSMFKLMGIFAT